MLIQTEDETVVVQTSRKRKTSLCSCVKPLNKSKKETLEAAVSGESDNIFCIKGGRDRDLDKTPYASIQNTKPTERGKTVRSGDLTYYSMKFEKLRKKKFKASSKLDLWAC